MTATNQNTGNRGASPLPPPGPADVDGNGLGQQAGYGTPATTVPANTGDPQTTTHQGTVMSRPQP